MSKLKRKRNKFTDNILSIKQIHFEYDAGESKRRGKSTV